MTNGINCGVTNYQAVGLAHVVGLLVGLVHVWFVFVLNLGHGEALKRRILHAEHTNSSKWISCHFQDSKIVIKDS